MKFEFTNEELNIVLTALNEMPHRIAAPIINKIVTEARKQEGESAPLLNEKTNDKA